MTALWQNDVEKQHLSWETFIHVSMVRVVRNEQRLILAHVSDLSVCSKLPSWARAVVPKIFYVTEKAWNYYPYTITGRQGDAPKTFYSAHHFFMKSRKRKWICAEEGVYSPASYLLSLRALCTCPYLDFSCGSASSAEYFCQDSLKALCKLTGVLLCFQLSSFLSNLLWSAEYTVSDIVPQRSRMWPKGKRHHSFIHFLVSAD